MEIDINKSSLGPVILDINGLILSKNDERRICHPLTGGVILFSKNFKNRKQLISLCKSIKKIKPGIIVTVDHEGGSVQRFKKSGFTILPPMRKLGFLWEKDYFLSLQVATAFGFILGSELLACGVDFSFTPVLDLDYGNSSVISDRAIHNDPRVVTIIAKSLSYGLMLAGMGNCGKHFPGHGYVSSDSHLEISYDNREPKVIFEKDISPYKWLGMSLKAVMLSHVVYPKFDNKPACFSKKWIYFLKKRLNFNGVIFSDDLSMLGARIYGDVLNCAEGALSSGCDLIIVCNSEKNSDYILEGLKYDQFKKSMKKICSLKPINKTLDWKKLKENFEYKSAKKILSFL